MSGGDRGVVQNSSRSLVWIWALSYLGLCRLRSFASPERRLRSGWPLERIATAGKTWIITGVRQVIIPACLLYPAQSKPLGWFPTSSSLNRGRKASLLRAKRSRKSWPSLPNAVRDAPVRPPAWNIVPSKIACFGCPTKTIRRLAALQSIPSCASGARNVLAKDLTAASSTAARGTQSPWSIRLRWKKKLGRWQFRNLLSAESFQLQQIPLVAVEILEDRDDAVRFFTRRAAELHAAGCHFTIVAPEIVGV